MAAPDSCMSCDSEHVIPTELAKQHFMQGMSNHNILTTCEILRWLQIDLVYILLNVVLIPIEYNWI